LNLKIGTRGSALALAQANHVKELLERARPGAVVELVVIKTSGDDFSAGRTEAAEETAALKGLFVKEIEEALLEKRVDLAVHSAKDMETSLPDGLEIGAVLKREDPRDAVVLRDSGSLAALPPGSRVGVSSLRRQSQLQRIRRDLELVPVRGNVDTRLKKLDAGECGALILAAAGLKRLGFAERIGEFLDPARFLPAPGQGALAVEIRAARDEVAEQVRALEDPGSRQEVEAERALLKALGGNCRVPVGALARVQDGNKLSMEGIVLSPDGLKAIRQSVAGPAKAAERLGKELASHLRAAGADRLLYGTWKKT